MIGRRAGAVLLLTAALLGCSDDDAATIELPTTVPPEVGDLAIDVPTGWTAVPLPSLGVGLAVPGDWQAIVLTEAALRQVEETDFPDRAFLAAARQAQAAGALLYAAGFDPAGGVVDVKLDRQRPAPGEGPAELASAAVVPTMIDPAVEALDSGMVALRFGLEQPAADDPDEIVVSSGTQWFVADGDVVWSLLVISEGEAGHDDLARALVETLTFD